MFAVEVALRMRIPVLRIIDDETNLGDVTEVDDGDVGAKAL